MQTKTSGISYTLRYNIMSPIDFHVLLSCIHNKYLMTGVEVWTDWGGTGACGDRRGRVCVCVCVYVQSQIRARERMYRTESRKVCVYVCVCMERVR